MTDAAATSPDPSTEDLAASLRLSVTRLARLLRQQADAGLTPTQLAALATIDRSGPLPVGALADEEQIGAPTATKIVEKLHAAGWVARTPSPDDRRVTFVSVTPSGEALLADIRARKTAWLTTRIDALDADDRQALAGVVAVLDHLTSPTRPAVMAIPPEEDTA
ncbi:MarR family winged helix-turn-helix transcriptional regulator [Aquihabitans daechungensis]|uniref:MarR family winged helix-turn-helix transcriptional regulator n=1 Tax=Aquihabitans daechungensis TaxID=1052257 RepID=UPI003BA2D174